MSWADRAIKKLTNGENVLIKPRGNSMKGKVNNKDLVYLAPILETLNVGDIVLVKVNSKIYLHLIKAINNGKYLIGNNKGRINGWVGRNSIYGIATKINGKEI